MKEIHSGNFINYLSLINTDSPGMGNFYHMGHRQYQSTAENTQNTMQLRPEGFSKYIIGISMPYGDEVKCNNFMIIPWFLNKLMHGGRVRC